MPPVALPVDLDLALTGLPEEEHLHQVWLDHLRAWMVVLTPRLPAHLSASRYSLGLTLCDDAEISRLNHDWRGQEGPTDVLAFAIQDAPIPWPSPTRAADAASAEDEPEPPFPLADDEDPEGCPLELGDIVISTPTARRQAEAEGHSLSRELLFLASHGLLHLLGWDHPDEPSLATMLALQEELLAATAHLPAVTMASCHGEATG
ncbi:MAG: rRNA maturation RNase YbeY [Cyanobacteria bacterium K_Offshore_surface_m2_239]|nr:rRNA maturation RNase YbeY [Cyanobacteria bacterium K_Offshore_surface_m2_239]